MAGELARGSGSESGEWVRSTKGDQAGFGGGGGDRLRMTRVGGCAETHTEGSLRNIDGQGSDIELSWQPHTEVPAPPGLGEGQKSYAGG